MGKNQQTSYIPNLNKAFIIGIAINTIYVAIEFIAGLHYNSLALIADAGHNLTDVATLALALLAFRLSRVKTNTRFTYGYRKSTILVSFINSVALFVVIGGILWESISRINDPVVVEGLAVSIVAGIGIIINAFSALLFFRHKDSDLNVKGAYLHLMADAAVSLGVVVSGLLIFYFQIYWLDLAISLVIVVVLFYSTWHLFRDSLFLSLDGVPKGISVENVVENIKNVEGVADLHHLHIWAMSTTQNALTTHIVIAKNTGSEKQNQIKNTVKHELEKLNIHHATLEFETEEERCGDMNSVLGQAD
jgi:cobalt-zinc-cadmium efflux system protein